MDDPEAPPPRFSLSKEDASDTISYPAVVPFCLFFPVRACFGLNLFVRFFFRLISRGSLLRAS